jgi:hypothetical protein
MSSDAGQSQTSTAASSLANMMMDIDIQAFDPVRNNHVHTIQLENYIPVGCIVSNPGTKSPDALTSWTEIGTMSPWGDCLPSDEAGSLEATAQKLLKAEWIRVCAKSCSDRVILRVYLLPHDIGRSQLSRDNKSLHAALEELLRWICVSEDAWNGNPDAERVNFNSYATLEPGSLFYIFNTLPSPDPNPAKIKDRYTRVVAEELMDDFSVPGLKTPLYPYQARSAVTMIQRETSPNLHLDPRFEERTGLDRQPYYFSPRELKWSKSPPIYESSRGGILAETMGLGYVLLQPFILFRD